MAEHTSPIKGRFLEALGFLNPHTKEKNFKTDRIKYWLEKGAQCSDTVHNLLVSNGIVKGPKRAVKLKKKTETVPASADAKTLADKESTAGEGEKKPAEAVEATPETKETEKISEEKQPEKESEEKESESAKPEPEKKGKKKE